MAAGLLSRPGGTTGRSREIGRVNRKRKNDD
jgi:hypothetical protein